MLQRRSFTKNEKLVSTLVKKLLTLATVEKQAAATEDLCGKSILLFQYMHLVPQYAKCGLWH